MKVTVVDMQPITPAVGGGRQRLLGLYHALGPDVACVYVGSYDWPGEPFRDQQLTSGLREIVVPLSPEHHAAAAALAAKIGGRTVIDIAFPDQVHLSPDFLRVARQHITSADAVVFSHPWSFAPLADAVERRQLVVYDSHNVESVLRTTLHDGLPQARLLLRRVAAVEYALCCRANLVLACSHEDRELFHRLYDIPWSKLRVVPNGIFAFEHPAPTGHRRAEAKQRLGIARAKLVLFVGSGYGPNNEAAQFINTKLATALTDVEFALVGGCGDSLEGKPLADNVHRLGVLDDAAKHDWMTAADAAVNPLAAGSGTSIKMFDFMAAGLPVVTTDIGARGIRYAAVPPFATATLSTFASALRTVLDDPARCQAMSTAGRRAVEDFYAWERISPNLGRLLVTRQRGSTAPPYFSVVIPSYERHAKLDKLIERLAAQSECDFEVIVVDQSAAAWPNAGADYGFPLRYVHSSVKGAVPARNLGGFLASGHIIAFTDDDCEPEKDWLQNAKKWFQSNDVVGIEGCIYSDHLHDPDWRPVSNSGCHGCGFMTANLMVQNDVFQQLNGFDIAFDRPHFREDTDFGWRMQALGKVPYADDVRVFHPAQPRRLERESAAARSRFFEKDALLLKRYPDRYKALFLQEAHYALTIGFWGNLSRGMLRYGVQAPSWLREYRTAFIAAHKAVLNGNGTQNIGTSTLGNAVTTCTRA